MIVDNSFSTKLYTLEDNTIHKRYLDTLKQEFLQSYNNSITYNKTADNFDIIKKLGKGSFGTVFLVRDKLTYQYLAMKCLEKEVVVKKNSVKQLYSEKKIFQAVKFPFLLLLETSCKDNVYLFFLCEYQSGGDLYKLMRKLGTLPEHLAQFYAAQVVLALEYLHHCGVVHRDVKPENIMIGISGYIKLGDFGMAKVIKSRTWTICGTPEYIAPEIIMSKGYTHSVDWWAFGVLVYEMNCGYPPFCASNPARLYEKVLTGHFKTPNIITAKCKSLIQGLLESDLTKRLGSQKTGVFDIKSHKWFEKTNWYSILNQKSIPPYIPTDSNSSNYLMDENEDKLKWSQECLYAAEFEKF